MHLQKSENNGETGAFDVARFHDVLISVRDAGTLVAPSANCASGVPLVARRSDAEGINIVLAHYLSQLKRIVEAVFLVPAGLGATAPLPLIFCRVCRYL